MAAQEPGQSSGAAEFESVVLLVRDNAISAPDPALLAVPDSNFSFLRDVIGFDDSQIVQFIADAEAFYRDRFGFDFTAVGGHSVTRREPKPLIIRDQAHAPMRFTIDGCLTVTCDVSHPEWSDRKAEGISSITALPDGRGHVSIRNVITFPGRLPDSER